MFYCGIGPAFDLRTSPRVLASERIPRRNRFLVILSKLMLRAAKDLNDPREASRVCAAKTHAFGSLPFQNDP
jgi:hypothetical protein